MIVVNLGAGEITDSGALHAIQAAIRRVEGRGELVLRSPRYRTLRQLASAGLDGEIPIC